MAINYRNVRAEGQEDGTLCWAACMAWWTRATNRVNRDQLWIQEEFSNLWEDEPGLTLSDNDMTWFLSDSRWRMFWEPLASGANLTTQILSLYLSHGPVYLGYYDLNMNSKHVNCIYKMGTGVNPELSIMEPRFSMKSDGSFEGKHLTRRLSYYQSPGSVIFIACPKP